MKAPASCTCEGLFLFWSLSFALRLTATASTPLSPDTPLARSRIPFCSLPSRRSISSQQTSSGIRIPAHRFSFHKPGQLSCVPSYRRNCSLSFHLIAMTLPFSAISQVADPICLPPSKISSTQNARKFFPPPCTLYLPLFARVHLSYQS